MADRWRPPARYIDPRIIPHLLDAARRPRDRALVAVLYYAGLRAFEAVALDTTDIDLDHGTLLVRHGKKAKRAVTLPLAPKLHRELAIYLAGWPSGLDLPLFPSRHARATGESRLRRERVYWIVREVAERAGLNPNEFWPHLLRHAFASHLLRQGVELPVVRDLMRHANIATTSLYAEADPERLRGAVERL